MLIPFVIMACHAAGKSATMTRCHQVMDKLLFHSLSSANLPSNVTQDVMGFPPILKGDWRSAGETASGESCVHLFSFLVVSFLSLFHLSLSLCACHSLRGIISSIASKRRQGTLPSDPRRRLAGLPDPVCRLLDACPHRVAAWLSFRLTES